MGVGVGVDCVAPEFVVVVAFAAALVVEVAFSTILSGVQVLLLLAQTHPDVWVHPVHFS